MSGDSHSNCLLSGTINIVISLILPYNQCNDPIQNQLNMINILFDYGKQPKRRFKYKHPGNSRQWPTRLINHVSFHVFFLDFWQHFSG